MPTTFLCYAQNHCALGRTDLTSTSRNFWGKINLLFLVNFCPKTNSLLIVSTFLGTRKSLFLFWVNAEMLLLEQSLQVISYYYVEICFYIFLLSQLIKYTVFLKAWNQKLFPFLLIVWHWKLFSSQNVFVAQLVLSPYGQVRTLNISCFESNGNELNVCFDCISFTVWHVESSTTCEIGLSHEKNIVSDLIIFTIYWKNIQQQ